MVSIEVLRDLFSKQQNVINQTVRLLKHHGIDPDDITDREHRIGMFAYANGVEAGLEMVIEMYERNITTIEEAGEFVREQLLETEKENEQMEKEGHKLPNLLGDFMEMEIHESMGELG